MHHKPLYLFFFLMSSSLCYGQALNQLSNSKDDSPIIIEADKSVVCDETLNKCVATGNAMAQKSTNIVYADILTVYFSEGKEREITSIVADGHVRMETPTDTAYDSQTKILNLEGDVILTSTDGYFVKTEKARVTFDNKVIEGDNYVEGKGPSGEIMAQDGFKVENQPQGKKVITLKGPSKVVIHKLKKTKDSNAP